MVDEDQDLDVDAAFMDRWFAFARDLAELTNPDDVDAAVAFQAAYRRRMGPSLLGRGGWPYHLRRPLTANLVDAYRRPASEHDSGVFRRGVGAKCLIWAWSLARGRCDEVPAHERSAILARHDLHPDATGPTLGRLLHDRRGAMAAADAVRARAIPDATAVGHHVVEVAFPWRRRGAAPSHGSIGHVPIVLPVRDPDAAPVAVRLSRPDGGWLDVRHAGGVWYRPVLAPGTWGPVGVDAFARAVRDGAAWADHPFARIRRGGTVSFDLHDVATPDVDPGPSDARRREATGRACVEGHRLSVVEGVVHMETARPVLGLLVDAEHRATAAWCLRESAGGLWRETTSVDDVSTCPPRHVRPWHWIPGFALVHEGRCAFPVTCANEMVSVHRRWAEALDAEGVSSVWVREAADGVSRVAGTLVDVVDREPFPAPPGEALLDMAVGVATHLAATLRTTFPNGRDLVPGMPRYGEVEAAFRAAANHLGQGDVDATLSTLDAATARFGSPSRSRDPSGEVFLRSVMAEAREAIASAPEHDPHLDDFRP